MTGREAMELGGEQAKQQQTPRRGGDLMEAAAAGPASMPASCDGVWGDLRFPRVRPSIGDWTWHRGRFQRVDAWGMHLAACHRYIHGLPTQAALNGRSCVEASGVIGRVER